MNGTQPSEATPARPASRTPVTIVTGFLGAGKTSLLNKVIKHLSADKRIAVIENEYGEVNLDGQLVVNQLQSKEDLVSISGGCACCSLRKDIISALVELQRRSTVVGRYDNIILETTGLADPGPVAFTFFANPWVKKRYHLDSIVTVVDAMHLKKSLYVEGRPDSASLPTSNELVNQIAFADLVLLNKIDLVTAAELAEVEGIIRGMNATARLVHTRLDADDTPQWLMRILDNGAFSLTRALEVDPQFLEIAESSCDEAATGQDATSSQSAGGDDNDGGGADSAVASAPDAAAATAPGPGSKRTLSDAELALNRDAGPSHRAKQPRRQARRMHDLGNVQSIGVKLPGHLDEYRFNMFMQDLLQECGPDIFRSKGTLSVHGREHMYTFQGVHETFQIAANAAVESNAKDPSSQLVFIGRNLDKQAIKAGLQTCMWRELPAGWREYVDPKSRRHYYVNSAGAKSWLRPEVADEAADNAAAAPVAGAGEEVGSAPSGLASEPYVSDINVKQPGHLLPSHSRQRSTVAAP